jgi:hypothetical protein
MRLVIMPAFAWHSALILPKILRLDACGNDVIN